MGNDIRIEIDRTTSGGKFTNYDTVSGTVTMVVTSSLAVSNILVKLEGIASTEMMISKARRNDRSKDRGERGRRILDEHRVLYNTVVVFPPENVRQVSKAKGFTLTPGNYQYPFEFKIPLNSSCVKATGITNAVKFNPQRFDFSVNNGNFNSANVKHMATQYASSLSGAVKAQHSQEISDYHVTSQLPPSLSLKNDFASIRYFVKVTCKRASLIKVNLRATDPFTFVPLNLDEKQQIMDGKRLEEYREVFVRKEIIFRNKTADINGVKTPGDKQLPPHPKPRGFFLRIMDPGSGIQRPQSSNVPSTDLHFFFEVRFLHPAVLLPGKQPSFRLFLVTTTNPRMYTNANSGRPDESNGLGVIYMQRLVVELRSLTRISVLEEDGSYKSLHRAEHTEVVPMANNYLQNLKLDLRDAVKQLSTSSSMMSNWGPKELWELEVPSRCYANSILPDRITPSFTTCNISLQYDLLVVGGFSSERVSDIRNEAEVAARVRYVELSCPGTRVLSDIGPSIQHPPPPITPRRPEAPPLPSKAELAQMEQHKHQESNAGSLHSPSVTPLADYPHEEHDPSAPPPAYDDAILGPN